MRYKAVIFDLDGVVCYTDEYHYLAWKALADKLGVPFDRAFNDRLRGVSRRESLRLILERYAGPALDEARQAALAEEKNALYRRYLDQMTPADLPPEVKRTLDALREKGVKLAIGSSSKNAPLILERIGLADFFDAVADGNCIARSKPDPEVFLKAAAMLGEAPESCLVVEDAVSGAHAGHDGGFQVACVGSAARAGAGDYNLESVSQFCLIEPSQGYGHHPSNGR